VERADRVLCDVPCSGFGVFAKKPELRYKDPARSAALPDIQRAILENACRYVKVGGRMVYSTCTLLPRENGENVARFLAGHPEFTLLRERTLYPDVDGTDGFYFAVLERI
jgi:16S rRNA (cytosine967-C5)-methyltransferase